MIKKLKNGPEGYQYQKVSLPPFPNKKKKSPIAIVLKKEDDGGDDKEEVGRSQKFCKVGSEIRAICYFMGGDSVLAFFIFFPSK